MKSVTERKTKETDIRLELELDGSGIAEIDTGIGFFDHMLGALAVHGGFDVKLVCRGDLEVDGHHTVEDCGIVLGKAFAEALSGGNIMRYGSARIPMDEALGECVVDISGRAFLVFRAEFSGERVGSMDTCLVEEFLRAFAHNSGMTIHASSPYGSNDHHRIEAIFKALAHALKTAVTINPAAAPLSTKGMLERKTP